MSRIIRSLIGISVVALSLVLVSQSSNISSANSSYYRALAQLFTQDENSQPSTENLQLAKIQIDRALSELPNDPNHLTTAGRITYLLAINEEQDEDRNDLLKLSKQLHIRALDQRPYWAYSEINILFAMHLLGEHNSDFQNRFSRAMSLAPEDKRALIDLSEISVMSWPHLTKDNQQAALKLLENVLVHNIKQTRTLALSLRQHNRFYQICAQLTQFPEKKALCNSY